MHGIAFKMLGVWGKIVKVMVPISCAIFNYQKELKGKREDSCKELPVCWRTVKNCTKDVEMLCIFSVYCLYTYY